jgi:hypothetical protein
MDLPYDIKELIALKLNGPDLAAMSRVDSDFTGFFKKCVGPIFRNEFIRISKIMPFIWRIYFLKATSEDIRYDNGYHGIMSYILDREVEEGELFEDTLECTIWRTMNGVVDLDPGLGQIMEEYKYNNGFHADQLFLF